jgi:uncharacterized cupin superfamily protein
MAERVLYMVEDIAVGRACAGQRTRSGVGELGGLSTFLVGARSLEPGGRPRPGR